MLVQDIFPFDDELLAEGPFADKAKAAAIAGMLGLGSISGASGMAAHGASPFPLDATRGGYDQVAARGALPPEPMSAIPVAAQGRSQGAAARSEPGLHPNFPDALRGQSQRTPAERKAAFVDHLMPMVNAANAAIRREREEVRRIAARRAPTTADQAVLERLAAKYRTSADPASLLRRIDEVPPSLVVAQAALESGWGTSAAARRSHSIFGQKAFDGGRGERYAAFDSFDRAIASYLLNLNSHAAYEDFRKARAQMRGRRGGDLDATALARTLTRYSELGSEYTSKVVRLMRTNRQFAAR